MPQPGRSDKQKRDAIAALRKAKGSRAYAASLVGMRPSSFRCLVMDLMRDPKWKHKVPPAPASATLMAIGDPRAEADRAARKVQFLEEKIERLRAVRVRPVRPARKRSGKDDEIVVAFPDVHGNQQDRPAVAAFLSDLKRLSPSLVVGLGDLVDAAGFLAQHQTLGFVAEAEYTWEGDVAAANSFLDGVDEASGGCEKKLLGGNHDERPEKWAITAALRNRVDAEFLRRQVATDVALRLKQRGITYHRRSEYYDGLSVQGTIRRGKILFTHGLQRGGGGAGLAAGQRMLQRFGTNVAYGHYHRLSQLLERDVSRGTIGAFNLGCLCKLQPLYQHGDPTNWNHGYGIFVMARSGNFLPITVPIVNGVSLLPELKL